MQLTFETNTEPRKRYHMINRKVEKEASKLEKMAMEAERRHARTKLELQAR